MSGRLYVHQKGPRKSRFKHAGGRSGAGIESVAQKRRLWLFDRQKKEDGKKTRVRLEPHACGNFLERRFALSQRLCVCNRSMMVMTSRWTSSIICQVDANDDNR